MKDNRDYPIFATQGGGYVRECNGIYIFVEAPPDIPSLKVGDEMPKEWGIIAANEAAVRRVVDNEFYEEEEWEDYDYHPDPEEEFIEFEEGFSYDTGGRPWFDEDDELVPGRE